MKNLFLSFFTAISIATLAQPGTLDSDFSSDGKLLLTPSGVSDAVRAVVIQPDQKILLAGQDYSSNLYSMIVTRLNTDGTKDAGFGSGGDFVRGYGSGNHSRLWATALQPDGKIIVGGHWRGNSVGVVGRLLANGTMDSTFGVNGFVTHLFGAVQSTVYAVAVQSDSLIVTAGSSTDGFLPNVDFSIRRYKPNGTPDSSFSVDGLVSTDFFSGEDIAYAMEITADNKILVCGTAKAAVGTATLFAAARYNFDGTLDVDFGNNGKFSISLSTSQDVAYGLAVQPNGKIVLAGTGFSLARVLRLNANGTVDSTFNNVGHTSFSWIRGNSNNVARAVNVQPDGKIVVAGYGEKDTAYFCVGRLQANGRMDSTFGVNGMNTTTFLDGGARAYCAALQSNGRLVAAGSTVPPVFYADTVAAVARYYTGINVGLIDFALPSTNPLVYPNPVSDVLNFKYNLAQNETISIALYDMQGRLVKVFLENEAELAGEQYHSFVLPPHIAQGNYLLSISSKAGVRSVQISK